MIDSVPVTVEQPAPNKETRIVVEDLVYQVREFNATQGLEWAGWVGNLIAGAANGVDANVFDIMETQVDWAKMVQGSMDRLFNKEFAVTVKRLVQQSVIAPEMTDEAFEDRFSARNLGALVELVAAVLFYNYGPLFNSIKKKIQIFTPQKS